MENIVGTIVGGIVGVVFILAYFTNVFDRKND
jgi:hypothetical protein